MTAAAVAAAGPSLAQRHAKRLLAHERSLLEAGALVDASHVGASAIWLRAAKVEHTPADRASAVGAGANEYGHVAAHYYGVEVAAAEEGDAGDGKGEDGGAEKQGTDEGTEEEMTWLYRPVGDEEMAHLLSTGELPSTQPYQTVVEGPAGLTYCEKYLNGKKWVNSNPTTIVEFRVRRGLVDALFALQHKPEDGVVSMGLGDKAGGGLGIFNDDLRKGISSYRIVVVKRKIDDKPRGPGKGGHGGSRGGGKRR